MEHINTHICSTRTRRETLRRGMARERAPEDEEANEKAKNEVFAKVLHDEHLVSSIVKHLHLAAINFSVLNVTFAKEARRCRPEYMTVCASVDALIGTLENTDMQEDWLRYDPSLRHRADEEDKVFWPAERYCRDKFGYLLLSYIVHPNFPIMKKEYL